MVVVDCTQVLAGGVDNQAYEVGAWLKGIGVVSGRDVTAVAAMTKLSLLLAGGASQSEAEDKVQTATQGDMRIYSS